jgi:tetratricopeptide (TPR) repeat protein
VRGVIRALPILLFMLFALFFNSNLVSVRVSELSYLLDDASGAHEVLNNSAMLGRFELLKLRLDQGESRVENYELEARIQALTAPRANPGSDPPATTGPLVRSLRGFLNALRFVLGKPAIHPEAEDATLGALEVAYLHERSRNYDQALLAYRDALPRVPLASNLRASVLLHVAFCDSMLNSIAEARTVLAAVITEGLGKEQAVVAWKLLAFLDLLEERRRTTLPGNPTDLDRAKQAYLLVDYSASIDLLTRFIAAYGDGLRLAEAFYYRGRSHEELGELAPAIDDYRAAASHPPSGSWAQEAARRLFLLGTVYGQGGALARDTLHGSGRPADSAFISAVTRYVRIIDPGTVAALLANAARLAAAKAPSVTAAPVASTTLPTAAHAAPQELPETVPPPAPPDAATGEPPGIVIASVLSPAPGPDAGAAAEPAETAVPLALPASAGDLSLPPLGLTLDAVPARVPLLEPASRGNSVATLKAARTVLVEQRQRELAARRGYDLGSWISLGAGTASTGAAAYFLYQAFAAYGLYQAATSAAEAKAMRELTVSNRTVAISAGVAGGLTLATALVLQLLAPPVAPTEDRIRLLDEAIEKLGQATR